MSASPGVLSSHLSTRLFSEPTLLNDLWERKGDSTHRYWALPYMPGKRLDEKPHSPEETGNNGPDLRVWRHSSTLPRFVLILDREGIARLQPHPVRDF
jgi:hypothetical protein